MEMDFIKERDRDLMNAYKMVLKRLGETARFKSRQEIFSNISSYTAKRFYVSPDGAMKIVSRIHRGKHIKIKNEQRKKMYYDIYDRFLLLKKEHPSISMKNAIYKIIYSPAPSFYLKETSLKVIFCNLQKKERCKNVSNGYSS